MKRTLLLLSLGIIGAVAVLRTLNQPRNTAFAENTGKNFGAFPPDIPPAQFDDLFI